MNFFSVSSQLQWLFSDLNSGEHNYFYHTILSLILEVLHHLEYFPDNKGSQNAYHEVIARPDSCDRVPVCPTINIPPGTYIL